MTEEKIECFDCKGTGRLTRALADGLIENKALKDTNALLGKERDELIALRKDLLGRIDALKADLATATGLLDKALWWIGCLGGGGEYRLGDVAQFVDRSRAFLSAHEEKA